MVEEEQMDVSGSIGWELNKKHIFILSSSGKPIYSRYGDELSLVTTFGLLQAIMSIVIDSGDSIKCMRAGKRKIVFLVKMSLYFVCMSSTSESELSIIAQLNFLYHQVLLLLTSKVHDVLSTNASADIRQLLGSDSNRLLNAACVHDVTDKCIVLESLKCFVCSKDLRDDILFHLKYCVEKSGAVVGILIWKDLLIAYCTNPSVSITLSTADTLLLIHFVANSNSFRSSDQHWVPICLPEFNSKGYLQAYISDLRLPGGKIQSSEVTIILVASAAEPELFKELHRGRRYMEQCLVQPSVRDRVLAAISSQDKPVDKYLDPSMSLHFLYKFRPSAQSGSKALAAVLPSQFVEAGGTSDCVVLSDSVWTHYQRLAVCIRRGSSTVEATVFGADLTNPVERPDSKKGRSNERGAAALQCHAVDGLLALKSNSKRTNVSDQSDSSADHTTLLSSPPSSDHALAYTVLSTGQVLVALATFDSELYVCYPETITPLDASTMADFLSRSLKLDAAQLFQTAL